MCMVVEYISGPVSLALHAYPDAPKWVGALPQHVVDLPPIYPKTVATMNCGDYISLVNSSYVTWWYNGAVVKEGTGNGSSLLQANNSRHGIFQCTVQNRYGRAGVTFRIRVPGERRELSFMVQFSCPKLNVCVGLPMMRNLAAPGLAIYSSTLPVVCSTGSN